MPTSPNGLLMLNVEFCSFKTASRCEGGEKRCRVDYQGLPLLPLVLFSFVLGTACSGFFSTPL